MLPRGVAICEFLDFFMSENIIKAKQRILLQQNSTSTTTNFVSDFYQVWFSHFYLFIEVLKK